MLIMFIGDPHIDSATPESRSDDYADTVLLKLDWCFSTAVTMGIREVWLAGDTFERTIESISFRLRVAALFRKYKAPLNIRSLAGNHLGDTVNNSFASWESRQLGEFISNGLLSLLDTLPISSEVETPGYTLGIVRGLSAYQYTKDTLPADDPLCPVKGLVVHGFLDTPDPLLSFKVKDLVTQYPQLEFIMAGHDHQWFPQMKVEGVRLLRPGSLMRTANDTSSNRIPQVLVYNTVTRVTQEIQVAVALPPDQVFHMVTKQNKEDIAKKARTFAEALAGLESEKVGILAMVHDLADKLPLDDKTLVKNDLAENGFRK